MTENSSTELRRIYIWFSFGNIRLIEAITRYDLYRHTVAKWGI